MSHSSFKIHQVFCHGDCKTSRGGEVRALVGRPNASDGNGMLGDRRHQVEQGGDSPCKNREDFLQLCLLPTYTELFSELLPCKEMRMQVVQQLTSAWIGQSECCWVLPDPGSLSVRSVCLAQ